ncbi:Sodium-dependent glucose transporter 1 [Holothuria leucospilota]|uniref:Sodium-dependent glucose transporter 1 n=1 Tax=Holothuria leucospilota TaxID=206669 RepID=A0A9Q1HJB5_HOLLE|nr:Sodium-dependent glucose transporter 1 [Holothuria leucospilota]
MDSDEEDVLYAPQNDPGRDTATLIGEGRKSISDIFQDNTEKLKQTLCFCAAFLGLGLSIAVVGPTLPDIMDQVDVHDYFQIAFIFTGRGVGYLGGFVFGNAFYGAFNPQSLIALSLFLAAIAMAMVSVTKKLYVLVMMMSVVGFASGILQKGAKVVSLGIGKTQASGFFRLIYFAFAVGAFISTLLVIPFSTPDGIATDVSTGTENTAKNQSFFTTNSTNRTRREVAIHLESWTTRLNLSLSSLSETTDKMNDMTSDIFIFTQELNEIVHNMIASVCNGIGSSEEPSLKEVIERLDNLGKEKDFSNVHLLNASAHSFNDTVSKIRSTLTNALSNVRKIKTKTPLIFDKCRRRLFLKKICQNYIANISSRVLQHVNATLEIVLPATNLDKKLTKTLETPQSTLEEIMSLTKTNQSNSCCNDTVFQILDTTANTVIQIYKTLCQSYKQGGVIAKYFREVLSQINRSQTEIGILSPICRGTMEDSVKCYIPSEYQNIDENKQYRSKLLEEGCEILHVNITASNATKIHLTIAYNNEFSDKVETERKFDPAVSDPADFNQIQDELEKQNCSTNNAMHIGHTIQLYCNHNIITRKTLKDVSRIILYENQNNSWLFICNMSVSSIPRDENVPPPNASDTINTNTSTNWNKKYVKRSSGKVLFDMTDSCNQIVPTIKYALGKSDCFSLSVKDAKDLNSLESLKNLSSNATEFRKTFKIMVAAETALTNINETLKHGQMVIEAMGENIKSILKAHNFDHEDICRFGLQSLVMDISRLNYCVTTGRHIGGVSRNIRSFIHSFNTTVDDMTDLITNVSNPFTKFDVDRLSNISKNQNIFARNLSEVAAVLSNDTSSGYYDKVFKSICIERINKIVEEITLSSNSKNIQRIADMCVKESPTSTRPVLSTQTRLSTPPLTTASSLTSDHVSTKFNMVYAIIAVYLGLASLLFLVLVQIPPLPRKIPTEELSGDLKIEQTAVVFFFHLLYTAAEVSFGAFVLVNYRSIFSDNSFPIVVVFWGSFSLGRFISLFLSAVISLTQYLVFSLAGNIVASIILVSSPFYGTYMFLLGTVVLAVSISTLFNTGDRWLKGCIPGGCVSNTFKYLFVAGDTLGGGACPLLVGYFMGDEKMAVMTPLIYTISVTNVILLFLFAYAYSMAKGIITPIQNAVMVNK